MDEIITLVSSDGTEFRTSVGTLSDNFTYFQGLFNSTWVETSMKRVVFPLFDKRIISSLIAYSCDKKVFCVDFFYIDFEEYLFFTSYFGAESLLHSCVWTRVVWYEEVMEKSDRYTQEDLLNYTSETIYLLEKYNVCCFIPLTGYQYYIRFLKAQKRKCLKIIYKHRNVCVM